MHVARRLDGPARHRQHVVLHQPVHAGDADRREQAADRRGNQADEQRDQHEHGLRRAGVDRQRLQRDDGDEKDDGEAGEQDVERDLVRRLLSVGAFDERDHAIEERLARVGGDLDPDPVREHARAAGHGGAVSAGLANHGRGLAGNRAFVDGRDTLDDVAVAGNDLTGRHGRHRPRSEAAPPTRSSVPSARSRLASVSVFARRSVSACALPRPSAIASAKLAKSTVSQSQTTICRSNRRSPLPVTTSWIRRSDAARSQPRRRTSPGYAPS